MNYNKDRPKYLDIPIIEKNKKVIKWIKLPIMKNKLTLTHITVKEQKVSNLTISPFREETYKSKVIHEFYSNMAFFKILSDYFNIIKQNPKIAKQHKITDISFFRHKEFMEAIELQNYSRETNVTFKLNGNMFNYSFDQYRQNDEYYQIFISSCTTEC